MILYGEENQHEWDVYLKHISPYFVLCKNKTVLEIAPFNGTHTATIESHKPKSITLVELNENAANQLRITFPQHTIIHDDIFFFLEKPRKFDIVVCAGLLYHLHSPLYLLELIANRISPQYMYIETYTRNVPHTDIEDDNTKGARQLKPGWKSANISIKLPEEIITTALFNMGYKLIVRNITLPKPSGIPLFCIFKKL